MMLVLIFFFLSVPSLKPEVPVGRVSVSWVCDGMSSQDPHSVISRVVRGCLKAIRVQNMIAVVQMCREDE